MAILHWIKEDLKKAEVDYAELHHRTAYTAQGVAEAEHVSGRQVAKAVVCFAAGRPLLAVLPANRRVDLKRLAFAAGAPEARLATEAEMARLFPDCDVGAEPPLPHWGLVELWMDETLAGAGEITFQAGTHQDRVRMRFSDWLQVARPRCASFSTP